jgi:hypothetical protein
MTRNPEQQRRADRTYSPKRAEKDRLYRQNFPEKARDNTRRWAYGIEPDEWTAIFEAQGRCCALCKADVPGSKRGWNTDHDYKTGRVRGILCLRCNIALGFYEKLIQPHFDRVQAYLGLLQ